MDFFTVAGLAAWLKIPKSSVYEMTRKRRIEVVKVGKHIRIPRHAAEEYVKANTQKPKK